MLNPYFYVILVLILKLKKPMRKQTIEYTSPLDTLVAVTKRPSIYENQQKMDSEEFFH